jgi:hypothetical protein
MHFLPYVYIFAVSFALLVDEMMLNLSVRLWRFAVLNIAAVLSWRPRDQRAAAGHASSMSRLYACDLIDAALGCLASPSLLFALGCPVRSRTDTSSPGKWLVCGRTRPGARPLGASAWRHW